jgi:hypothetical protein
VAEFHGVVQEAVKTDIDNLGKDPYSSRLRTLMSNDGNARSDQAIDRSGLQAIEGAVELAESVGDLLPEVLNATDKLLAVGHVHASMEIGSPVGWEGIQEFLKQFG